MIGAITGVSAGFSAILAVRVDLLAFTVVSPLTLVGAHDGARKAGELDSATLTRWIAYALIPTVLVVLAEVVLMT